MGPLEAVDDDGKAVALGGKRPRAVLAMLLLRPNETVSTDRLIDAVWGEAAPAKAQAALQVHVHALRKALGAGRIVTRAPGYLIRVEPGELDVQRFEELVAAGTFRQAEALWRGPALADLAYEPFAQTEAARLEERRLAAIEARVEAELVAGRHRELVAELETLVAEHPARDGLQAQRMLALYRSGRQTDALEAYRSARTALAELGLEPTPELRALERRILEHDPSLAAPARIGVELAGHDETALVGRQLELAAISALLERSDVRVVTLTGPGGSGKTRLATIVAAGIPDAVFVDLSPLVDAALALPAIAGALGLGEISGSELEALCEELEEHPRLLVLDNLEQLPAFFSMVGDLLAAAPSLTVLTTSRVPLRISAEHEYRVPPLAVPEPGAQTVKDVETDAVRLYVARARAEMPSFELSEANAGAIARICRALDGLPLAIELAAARVRVLGPEGTAKRLGERLSLLTRTAPDLPERRRSLRAAIDWSYQLLDEDAQRVFRAVGVFVGGATLDGVEAVVGSSSDVPAALEALLDASLVLHDSGHGGEPRFGMLETVREFALETLARSTHESRTVRDRHFSWCLRLAEGEDPRYWTRGSPWLEQVAPEHDNMRSAVAHSEAIGDIDGRLRLVCALCEFLRNHGHVVEATRLLDVAVEDAKTDAVDDAVQARVLAEAGMVLLLTPDRDRAEALLLEALERFEALGNRIETGRTELRLYLLAYQQGKKEAALGWAMRAHASLAGQDPYLEALSLAHVGSSHLALGDLDSAREPSREAFSAFAATEDDRGLTVAASILARVQLADGDTGGAGVSIDALLRASEGLDSPEWIAYGLELAAELALALGRPDDASVLIAAFDRELDALGIAPDDGRRRHAEVREQLRSVHGRNPANEQSVPLGEAVERAHDVAAAASVV